MLTVSAGDLLGEVLDMSSTPREEVVRLGFSAEEGCGPVSLLNELLPHIVQIITIVLTIIRILRECNDEKESARGEKRVPRPL